MSITAVPNTTWKDQCRLRFSTLPVCTWAFACTLLLTEAYVREILTKRKQPDESNISNTLQHRRGNQSNYSNNTMLNDHSCAYEHNEKQNTTEAPIQIKGFLAETPPYTNPPPPWHWPHPQPGLDRSQKAAAWQCYDWGVTGARFIAGRPKSSHKEAPLGSTVVTGTV